MLAFLALATSASAATVSFADEFSGPLSSSWATLTPWYSHHTTGELEYYSPSQLSFDEGNLRITTTNATANGYAYQSGIVTSLNRAKFSYGYFEMRAKLPKGKGIWPAFWLTNDSTLEIDAMELLGDAPGRVYCTYHHNGSQVAQYVYNGGDLSTDFHTYAVDWQPTFIRWYIDGALVGSYSGSVPSDPMWLCLNTAVGGWAGSPDASTVFPVTYDVDYVHVFDSKPDASVTPTPVPTPIKHGKHWRR
jgi:beta-glucanase (GH16 family)